MLIELETVAWLVGPPGVGKTTAARQLLGPLETLRRVPKPKWTYSADGSLAAAGHYTGDTFDGADTVPYSGAAEALAYFEDNLVPGGTRVVVFDGDRFSHKGARERALAALSRRSAAYGATAMARAICVYFDAPEQILGARRAARGSNQDPTWLKGRATKAARFPELFPEADRFRIDASAEQSEVAERLAELLWRLP